jgi:protein O-GlcNAc transferase
VNLIEQAVELHAAGQWSAAEDLYRRALEQNPENADAWRGLGVLAHQCGQSEQALEWIQQALQLAPEHPVFWNDLGDVLRGVGRMEDALESYERALVFRAAYPECLANIGSVLGALGRTAQAIPRFQQALALSPEDPGALTQYGVMLLDSGRADEAEVLLRRACAAAPQSVEPPFHLAAALDSQGKDREALAMYERCAQMAPKVAAVWTRWGRALLRLGHLETAAQVFAQGAACPGNPGECFRDLGQTLHRLGRSPEALDAYEKARASAPNEPELHNELGIVLKDLGRFTEAAQSFHQALALNPGLTSALNNLGAVCNELGLTTQALECFKVVLERNPQSPGALSNIGKILKDRGKSREGVEYYRRALALDPDNKNLQHNLLLGLQYLSGESPARIFEAHADWGRRLVKKNSPLAIPRTPVPGRLRVGYVSPDFCLHPVAMFLEPLLARHQRDQFEVTLYSDVRSPDRMTERIRSLAEHWRDTAGMDTAALADLIRADRVDLLVDLAGHTAGNRLEVFARKPAPVQVTYLGYPGTTGLPTMDYRITDAVADPEGMTDALHSEKLLRLGRCAWCFSAPSPSPEVGEPPFLRNGFVTFGCFNQMAKWNPELLENWAAILQRVPGSHLKLKARSLLDPAVCQELTEFFAQRGIASERLELSGFAPTAEAHLAEYERVDIGLDSFPYHGTTTTCEALWMGVPVVTRMGAAHVSRVSGSLLDAVGLSELAGQSDMEYRDIAVQLAAQPERLEGLRAGLRERMKRSPLMDAAGFAAAMEACFLRAFAGP